MEIAKGTFVGLLWGSLLSFPIWFMLIGIFIWLFGV